MIKHLDHLNMSVRSVDEQAAWYGRVFGFTVVERGERAGQPWAILRSGDAMLCIYEDPSREALDSDGLRERHIHGLNHFGLRVTDRERWERILANEQLAFSYPSPVEWPHSTAWYVRDPSGYEIEVACWHDDRVQF